MGKCKQRLMGRSRNISYMYDMTRHQAIDFVINELTTKSASLKARNMISLFGLNTEELTEAGAKFEEVLQLEKCLALS